MPFLNYQFRLYPTPAQEVALGHQLETLRQVYNTALAWWLDAYQYEKAGRGNVIPRRAKKSGDGERKLGLVETLYPIISGLRNLQLAAQKAGESGPHWLTQVSAASVRDTLKKLDGAFLNFYRRIKQGVKKAGYPRFKKFGGLQSIHFDNYPECGCSLRLPGGTRLVKPLGGVVRADCESTGRSFRLYVAHAGMIRAFVHRPIVGKIKTASVKRDTDGKWYVFLVAEQVDVPVAMKVGDSVGVDLGLANFLTTSDGDHVAKPRFLTSTRRKLRKYQRAMCRKMEQAKRESRKLRTSRNYQKSRLKTARVWTLIRNQSKEFNHKTAKSLVERYATVCVEKLNVRGMVRNGNLSLSIWEAGWSGFVQTLKQHAAKAGVSVHEVHPAYTSQTCSRCGHCESGNRSSQSSFVCLSCGHSENADVNAAKNILIRASGGAGSVPVWRNVDRPPVVNTRAKIKRAEQITTSGQKVLSAGGEDHSRLE